MTQTPLVTALQHGGLVILMRHAHWPGQRPEPAQADPENTTHERQLDARGRESAEARGHAFGAVLASPAYRALQTAGLAQLHPSFFRRVRFLASSLRKGRRHHGAVGIPQLRI